MLFMILLVAAIVFIDLSGSNLTGKTTPLIYISLDNEAGSNHEIEIGESYSPEDLAAKAQDHIFGGGKEKCEKAK